MMMLDSEIEEKNRLLVKKRKSLSEAVKDWENAWNEAKQKQADESWNELWATEIALGKVLTFDEWLGDFLKRVYINNHTYDTGETRNRFYGLLGDLNNFYSRQVREMYGDVWERTWRGSSAWNLMWKDDVLRDVKHIENYFPFLLDGSKGFGIVNMTDDIFFDLTATDAINKKLDLKTVAEIKALSKNEKERMSRGEFFQTVLSIQHYKALLDILKERYEEYLSSVPFLDEIKKGKSSSQIGKDTWSYSTDGKKYGSLKLNNRSWAVLDLGVDDPARKGGLIKYGGYGRPEPKKYLRGHLYPETLVQEGWMPKKNLKTMKGKPYPILSSALDKKGNLHTYGPEYYD